MKPEDLFDAMSDIDENMVEKAKPFKEDETVEPIMVTAKKRGFKPFYAAAACVGAVAVGAAGIAFAGMNRGVDVPFSSDTQSASESSTVSEIGAVSLTEKTFTTTAINIDTKPSEAEYDQNYIYPYAGDYSEITDFDRPKNILDKHYTSYEELAGDSDLIVRGVFADHPHQDVDPNPDPDIPLGTNIFSQCKFEIYDVIKGDANIGDIIVIAQSTGVYGNKCISTSQLTPMVKGDEWYYFLKKYDNSDVYYAVNDSDGRYLPPTCDSYFHFSALGYDNDLGYSWKECFNENIVNWKHEHQDHHSENLCHKVFDAFANKNDYSTDKIPFTMEEYPDVEFARSVDINGTQYIEAVYNNQLTQIYGGMPVENVYLCDLNGDGKREICATAAYGSGMIDSRVMVCDWSGCPDYKVYELCDRGNFDYVLKDNDGTLTVSKYKYNERDEISNEPLTLSMMKAVSGEGTETAENTAAAETPTSNSDSQMISYNKNMGNYSICANIEAKRCAHGRNCYDLIQNDNNICIKDSSGNVVCSRAFPWQMNVYAEADSADLTFEVLEFDGGNMLAMGFPVNVNGTQCRRMSFFCFDNSSISYAGVGDNYNFDETNPVIKGDLRCEDNCVCFSVLGSDGSFGDCHYLTDFTNHCFTHCEGSGCANHNHNYDGNNGNGVGNGYGYGANGTNSTNTNSYGAHHSDAHHSNHH